ncbi:flagellar motor switch protein FliG [Thermosulfidibacter takaii ABI70S6]|uniref:Flagellar motor switch protein FliG n=1 Tax=Thermosulfidibacter takaii (strain DSM 17441 / JCM 13301 / NBRC 103674 / ABI70S6) TaxID=1298851 RepID=A0A0S3QT08_THET7|nr:flagellar motor switch protein FliG [Thermosulfidibacter takaii]BAT71436.1 flagellar motor switch protein FliG [Thermosulfidibacter takaii ABI70S6]
MAEEVKEKISVDELSGVQKAAILMILLGPEVATKVFRELSEDVIMEITKEIAMIKAVDPEVAKEVLEEFFTLTVAKEHLAKGGVDYAKKILIEALGPEKAKKVVASLVKNMETSIGFEALKNIRPQQLAKIIQKEHPQTIALILAHLDPPKAAESLAELPESLRVEVVKRLASLSDISPEVLRRLSVVLEEKLQNVSVTDVEIGGPKTVAEILNRLDRETTKEILDELAKQNPEMATQIRDLMFVFEDIIKLDDFAIREILKRVDKKVLTVALKGASEELKEKFFRNMSQRAAETLKEEMEYLGPVKLKDVEAAQREIVELVRKLEDEGVISIGGAGEEVIT